jgi:hypothetical protein
MVNGGDVGLGNGFTAGLVPNLDSVAEFRLITNSFDAEYGRFSGSVVNALTKSGTNSIHGSVFEFLRNQRFDSRGFFDPQRADLKRNQFGYAVGGRILRNRLFWFTDYQGTREIQGVGTGLILVPTLDQRAGILSPANLRNNVNGSYWASVLSRRLGTTVTAGQPYSTVFPGGVIPQRAFSPVSVNLLKYIGLPNQGPNSYATSSANRRNPDDKAGQRMDVLNRRAGNFFAYYHFNEATSQNPLGGSTYGGFPNESPRRTQQGVLNHVYLFGPSAVNEARVSFFRNGTYTNLPGDPLVPLKDLGFVTGVGTLGIVPSGPEGWEGVPNVSISDFSGFGRSTYTRQTNNTWHIAETVSKILGRHTMKFGFEGRYLQINARRYINANGSFSFNGSETGFGFADFLLGAPNQYIQAALQVVDSRTKYAGVFAEDSFRIRPNLTINYGLRWEFSMPWYDTQDRIETLVPGQQSKVFPTAPKGWLVPGDDGIPRTLAPTDYNNFNPRVGIAWSPNSSGGVLGKLLGGPGKTSIRVSSGVFTTAIEDATLFIIWGDAPYGMFWLSIVPPLIEEPFRNRSDGVSQGQRFPFELPIPGSQALKTMDWSVFLPISSSPGFWKGNRLPYSFHWNFNIQRQLAKNMVASVGYVGTAGRKLMAQYESNPGDPALCLSLRGTGVAPGTTQCGPSQEGAIFTRPDGSKVFGTRGPFGYNFGSGNGYEVSAANSSYNSLQATIERRARDFTFLASYTFSKSMDNASGFSGMNFMNFNLSRALSSFDITHNFVASYGYEFPFDHLVPGAPKRLTQGWSINGITRLAGGQPIGISQTGDRSLTGAGNDEPDYIGGLVITQNVRDKGPTGRVHEFFNKEAFVTGPLGAYGNANQRFFHGPGTVNTDMGLHKTTKIRENIAMQFRAEFFNFFNHGQFSNPTGSFTSANFGIVTGARSPRIGQLSLKVLW